MRDKGLVFEEMRRQRRVWKSSWSEASIRMLVALVALLFVVGLIEARKDAGREDDVGHSPARGARILEGHDEQPWGGGHGAKSK